MKKIGFLFIGFCLLTNLSAQKVYKLDRMSWKHLCAVI